MIAFNAKTDRADTTGTTTLSFNATTTGSNGILFVGVSNSTNDVTGVTYNGVAMTKIGSTVSTSEPFYVSMWYLKNPTTGTNSVQVTRSGSSGNMHASSVFYTGALQGSGLDATSSGSGTAASLTGNVTTVANNSWVVLYERFQSGSDTAGASTIKRNTASDSDSFYDSNGPVSPAGSRNLVVNSSSSPYGYVVASFAPAAEGGVFLANFL